MEASEKSIKDIFTGGKEYIIPPYQRPYKWDPENAGQLIDDILDSYFDREKEYFIGSIICIKKSGDNYEVIDGQQRLITLTLIFLSLKDKIEGQKAKNILEEMVVKSDDLSRDAAQIFSLTVRQKENQFYRENIVQGQQWIGKPTATQKIFLNNKKRIDSILSLRVKDDKQLREIAKYIRDSVKIIFVEVGDFMSAYRLFNVLNNRGMPLSDADLIKNQLLSEVADEENDASRVEYRWSKIEDKVGEENLNDFLSLHQVSEKIDRNRVVKKNFRYYGDRLRDDLSNDSMRMLDVLHRSASYRYRYQENDFDSVRRNISFLNLLSKPSEWEPAFMAFLNKGYEAEFASFVELFEKVYMHRLLAGEQKSKRETVCYHAIEAINTGKSPEEILAIVRELAGGQSLDKALDRTDFYDASRPLVINIVKSVLLCVDARRHDDSVHISHNLSKITVEHILPQSYEEEYWLTRFTKEECKEWCNKLGNLTLLSRAKNSAARNFSFETKKKAYEKANQKPSFEITKEILDYEEWNMENLQARHKKLKDEIKKLWAVETLF